MERKNLDPFLKLTILASELWNERKGLDWASEGSRKRSIEKLEKMVSEIKALDWETEFLILEGLYLNR